jgi:hypothetical protein
VRRPEAAFPATCDREGRCIRILEGSMDAERDDLPTDPPMPPDPMRERVPDDDLRDPSGEPPMPPEPMRDRDPDADRA